MDDSSSEALSPPAAKRQREEGELEEEGEHQEEVEEGEHQEEAITTTTTDEQQPTPVIETANNDAIEEKKSPETPVEGNTNLQNSSSNNKAGNGVGPEQRQLSQCVKEPSISYREPYNSGHRIQRLGGKYHVLLAVTGSVAAIKTGELIQELYRQSPANKLVIKVLATPSALNFFKPEELTEAVYDDRDEWNMWKKRGDPVLHIELRKWADSLLVAPLDANTLAKVANGLCDNLVTSLVRAWDQKKPLYFAPAMNTAMWDNPLTYQHLKTLKELLLYREIPPMEKELMCGDKGYGAMAALPMIASIVAADIRNKFAVYSYHNMD